MFNIGPAEVLVVLVIALLVLGPNKLPDAARQVGKAIGELRRLSSGFQAEMRDALKEPVDGTPTSGRTASTAAPAGGGALASPRPPAGDVAVDGGATGSATATNGAEAADDNGHERAGAPETAATEPGANGTSPD